MNVYMLIDRSGSMDSLWKEVKGSIDGYISKLEDPDTKVVVDVFDSVSHDTLFDGVASDWKIDTFDGITPRGGTPLFDSAARIMARAEADNAEKTILVVMTDGDENSRHEVNCAALNQRVKSWEDKEWEVIFLGAAFREVERVSAAMGGQLSKTANFAKGSMLDGMVDLAYRSSAYATSNTRIVYSTEEKAQFVKDMQ